MPFEESPIVAPAEAGCMSLAIGSCSGARASALDGSRFERKLSYACVGDTKVQRFQSPTGIAEVLVTGSHTAQTDFRHYVDKHRPALVQQIVGWETVDHPTEGQLLAFARQKFVKYDRMAGTAT